ncbi:MAG: GNAT family N-acetyltransferase [Chloroflexota bacterium]
MTAIRIIDIGDEDGFRRLPPCADPRFDHRTCDYWEDADRGSRDARASWLAPVAPAPAAPVRRAAPDNPFAPAPREASFNPFAPASASGSAPGAPKRNPFDPFADDDDEVPDNPFAPTARVERGVTSGVPRKLALLDRGRSVFGSYAKVLLMDDEPVAYTQFGPLSAYPRAQRLRELYRQLPDAPLPAVITCIATTAEARGRGLGKRLVLAVCDDLASRGFAAIEAYPDLTQPEDATSAARPAFWEGCGFRLAVADDRFPVMRRELD